MRGVSLPFRKALVLALSNINYLGLRIPVWAEYLGQNPATLPVGNNKQAKAWVQITNQTSDNNSPKCHRNDLASIQIQVRVSYNANSGSYEHVDKISDIIIGILFPDQNEFNLQIESPFHVWNMNNESERNIDFQDDTDRVWMKNILITAQIEQ